MYMYMHYSYGCCGYLVGGVRIKQRRSPCSLATASGATPTLAGGGGACAIVRGTRTAAVAMGTAARVFRAGRRPLYSARWRQQQSLLWVSRCPNMVEWSVGTMNTVYSYVQVYAYAMLNYLPSLLSCLGGLPPSNKAVQLFAMCIIHVGM